MTFSHLGDNTEDYPCSRLYPEALDLTQEVYRDTSDQEDNRIRFSLESLRQATNYLNNMFFSRSDIVRVRYWDFYDTVVKKNYVFVRRILKDPAVAKDAFKEAYTELYEKIPHNVAFVDEPPTLYYWKDRKHYVFDIRATYINNPKQYSNDKLEYRYTLDRVHGSYTNRKKFMKSH